MSKVQTFAVGKKVRIKLDPKDIFTGCYNGKIGEILEVVNGVYFVKVSGNYGSPLVLRQHQVEAAK